MLSILFPTLFAFWPLRLFSPFTWKRARLSVNLFLGMWFLLLVIRVGSSIWLGESIHLIPEPANTILFASAGVVLLGIWFIRRDRTQSKPQGMFSSITDSHAEIDPDEFEDQIAQLFKSLGHQVQKTGGQGDHGIDLVVQSKRGEKWIVQCKRWKGFVGEPVVRDLYGSMHHAMADRAAIVTTGGFTEQALAWAKEKPIDLIDGKELKRIEAAILRERKRGKVG